MNYTGEWADIIWAKCCGINNFAQSMYVYLSILHLKVRTRHQREGLIPSRWIKKKNKKKGRKDK